mmetsp:Transcript_19595/g.14050  ORF Transcript_19595/g.14050 Transcript_19595/m.14050 type:complete len:142 (+) Transcript_19595:45-470(+)|eukprot:CAMPEP_0116936826 /NCGR_PEP_ID=MMETSP0467-20121206/31126_1 /TAXON_ID=283647 /ORGANISM="Mesodinium pulex, Strain SPMC105" /LENGTH=141 /DNA_ID=CAMNT_0004618497 /DNA_START=57 /DNA_END=482 /DNA_ORIENTATION=+
MSDALVWQLIKNNNAFLVKRERSNRSGAVQFSKESGNLLNVNSFKYSGIANSKAIGIDTSDKTITMTLKASKKTQKPSSTVKVGLRKYAKTSLSAIEKQATSPFYRADLKSAAKARYLRMYGDVRVKKGLAKKAIMKHHRK